MENDHEWQFSANLYHPYLPNNDNDIRQLEYAISFTPLSIFIVFT